MIKSILLASVVGLLAATSAMSADAVDYVPQAPAAAPTMPTFAWDGFYVGLHAGYGWADGKISAGGASETFDFDGARFGGFAGYNWTVAPSTLVGIEADLSYDANEETYNGDTGNTSITGGVRGRVGYAMDRALVYAAGGWTATRFDVEGAAVDETKMLNGWTIGAGVDYAFTDRVFGRLEYRYNDYLETKVDGVDVDFRQHVINAGVGVKF
nr:outer membrane protein [Ciceribacter sp. L1K22]